MENHIINTWFLGLEKGRQEVLLADKWMLANAFGEYVDRDNRLKMYQVRTILEKIVKHNTLTDHDTEMVRQVLEGL